MTAKGWSLHIGLNAVDAKKYEGWPGTLHACEADAHDMASIAASRGYAKTTKLFTKSAKRTAVLAAVRAAASALKSGDIFFLSYSGHGGQVPDQNGDGPDHLDETWCLYDGELIDDELYTELVQFRAGVRVLVLSDSCHSGTVVRMGPPHAGGTMVVHEERPAVRAMPAPVAARVYLAHKAAYDKLQKKADPKALQKMKASVRLVSGCMDNQTSSDGTFNGLFTGTLLHVYNGGRFEQGYAKFVKAIRKAMPSEQQPNHFLVGPHDTAFDDEAPFEI